MKYKKYLFIIESPSAFDHVHRINEGEQLKQLSHMAGIPIMHNFVYSKDDFSKIIKFIDAQSEIGDESADKYKNLIIIHVSCHGNNRGFQIGRDSVSWDDLVQLLEPLMGDESELLGERILTLSACGSEMQKLSEKFQKLKWKNAPIYIFTNFGHPNWFDLMLQWAMFYSKISQTNFAENPKDLKIKLKNILENVNKSLFPGIKYFRRDDTTNGFKYKKWPTAKTV